MRKLIALIYKDYLLMVRDLAGLAMMFVMPICLVAIMSYLQDSTFNSITETKIKIILLNADQDSLGNAISSQLHESNIFNIEEDSEGLTQSLLEKKVADGEYQLGIFVPQGTTAAIRSNIRQAVLGAFGATDSTLAQATIDSIRIYIDPTTKNSFKATITSSIKEFSAKIQTRFILNEVTAEVNKLSPMPVGTIAMNEKLLPISEQYAKSNSGRIVPNSVQHNVPAWAMFAVFFIVISLSGNIIKERQDGSYTRLLTMPCSFTLYISSKVIVYFTICMIQFTLMFAMGVYVLPLLGLPSLELGHSVVALLLICTSAALAAIGYGIAIGKIASSDQQAAVFGSISVVIMAAIGGIWIPTFVMPPIMQTLSHISPLNWGLSGFYDIFARDCGIESVLPECATLLGFALACVFVTIIYDKQKIR